MPLRTTPFHELHTKHNARMEVYGRWVLPLRYGRVRDEHLAVRSKAGLFDISCLGKILVTGRDAERLLERLFTNRLSHLKPMRAAYGVFCNERGGVVDDLMVFRYNRDKILLTVNPNCLEKDLHWVKRHTFASVFFDVKVQDLTEELCGLAIQGPESGKILERLVRKRNELRSLTRFGFYEDTVAGVSATVSRTGYTGELGFELFFNRKHARQVWEALLKEGKGVGLALCGWAARDTLRLEKGYVLYGQDLTEAVTPLEAGLNRVVSFRKDFVGRRALEAGPPARRLVMLVVESGRVPRQGYPVLSADGVEVGHVTSGGVSFSTGRNIGLALVAADHGRPDTVLRVRMGRTEVEAKVVRKPYLGDRRREVAERGRERRREDGRGGRRV